MSDKLSKFRIKEVFDGGLSGVREDGFEGDLTQAREGEPLAAGQELVQIHPSDEPGTIRLRTLYKHHGPPRASTKAFRNGYDKVFGGKDLN